MEANIAQGGAKGNRDHRFLSECKDGWPDKPLAIPAGSGYHDLSPAKEGIDG
jgi:hypothetical protein